MAVKVLQVKSTAEETYALLQEECGIEITEPSISSGILTANFKFPGMSEAVSISIKSFATFNTYLIVDAENLMLCEILIPTSMSVYYGNGNATDAYRTIIFNNNGTPKNIMPTSTSADKFSALFDISSRSYLKNMERETELIPLYGYDNNNHYYKMPNFYIARNKMFYANQTLVDETGTKYVTLGGCILYKM